MAARRRSLRLSGIRRRKQNDPALPGGNGEKLLLSTNPPGPTPYDPQTVISEVPSQASLAVNHNQAVPTPPELTGQQQSLADKVKTPTSTPPKIMFKPTDVLDKNTADADRGGDVVLTQPPLSAIARSSFRRPTAPT